MPPPRISQRTEDQIVFELKLGKKPCDVLRRHPEVAKSLVYRIKQSLENWGTARPPSMKRMGPQLSLDGDGEEYLVDVLASRPTIHLYELQYSILVDLGLYLSPSTIRRAIQRVKHSGEVAQRIAEQRNEFLRGRWFEELSQLKQSQCVFVDESACSERTLDRKYGWAPVGQPDVGVKLLKRSTRWSVLPAYSIDGYLPDTLVVQGAVDGATFRGWLEERVLPHCNPWPEPRSVVIMDDCKAHKGEEIIDLCQRHGVLLKYLPPCSPDCNPIEPSFHLLKAWMKRWNKMAPTPGEEGYDERFETFLVTAVREFGKSVDHRKLFTHALVPPG